MINCFKCGKPFKNQEILNGHLLFIEQFLMPTCSTGLALKQFENEQEALRTISELKQNIAFRKREAIRFANQTRGVKMFVEVVEEYNELFDQYLVLRSRFKYLKNLSKPIYWENLLDYYWARDQREVLYVYHDYIEKREKNKLKP